MGNVRIMAHPMIALLTGQIVSRSPSELTLDVSGVGYQVFTTLSTYERLPEDDRNITLYIYTYVREDNLSLYGFLSREEKALFIKLLKVNGIGPKLALAILSGVPPHEFVEAVTGEDLARLNAIPGVGRKTAERIIIDLKDKLTDIGVTRPSVIGAGKAASTYDDALSALLNLGYKKPQAERVLGKVGVDKDVSLTNVIKNALRELSNR